MTDQSKLDIEAAEKWGREHSSILCAAKCIPRHFLAGIAHRDAQLAKQDMAVLDIETAHKFAVNYCDMHRISNSGATYESIKLGYVSGRIDERARNKSEIEEACSTRDHWRKIHLKNVELESQLAKQDKAVELLNELISLVKEFDPEDNFVFDDDSREIRDKAAYMIKRIKAFEGSGK